MKKIRDNKNAENRFPKKLYIRILAALLAVGLAANSVFGAAVCVRAESGTEAAEAISGTVTAGTAQTDPENTADEDDSSDFDSGESFDDAGTDPAADSGDYTGDGEEEEEPWSDTESSEEYDSTEENSFEESNEETPEETEEYIPAMNDTAENSMAESDPAEYIPAENNSEDGSQTGGGSEESDGWENSFEENGDPENDQDSDESDIPDPEEFIAEEWMTGTLTTSFITADNTALEISAVIPEEAEIPAGSELLVTEIADRDSREYYLGETAAAYGWSSTAFVSFSAFLDISIVCGGEEVIPAAETEIAIRVDQMTDTAADVFADSICLVSFSGDPEQAWQVMYTAEAMENSAVLTFMTDGFGRFGLAGIEEGNTEPAVNDGTVLIEEEEQAEQAEDSGLEHLTLYADAGEAGTVALDGMMPKEAEASAVDASDLQVVRTVEDDTYAALAAYDITISNDGTEFQPAPEHPITVVIENDSIRKGTDYKLWHIRDDGTAEEVKDFTVKNGKVTFEASGFSVYVLTEDTFFHTYKFYVPADETQTSFTEYRIYTDVEGYTTFTQVIRDGEQLVIPRLPSVPGVEKSTFAGWYADENTVYDIQHPSLAAKAFDFNKRPAVTSTKEYHLYARFSNYAYVIFHEQYNGLSGSWPVTVTRRGELSGNPASASVEIDDVKAAYDSSVDSSGDENAAAPVKAFRGWTTESGLNAEKTAVREDAPILSGPLTISGNTDLYPVFVNINWLTFISGPSGSGATYYSPAFFYEGEGMSSFSDYKPVRRGYTFAGWYADEACTKQISDANGRLMTGTNLGSIAGLSWVGGKLVPSQNSAVYAKWTEAPSEYTVVVWRQKVTDGPDLAAADRHYDFAESFLLNAKTGSTVSVADSYKQFGGSGAYTGFSYSRCDSAKTAEGNGSTVLNVYYDRNVRTLTFKVSGSTVKTIKALYGTVIKDYFPIVGTNGRTYNGYTWTDNGTPKVYPFVLSTIETMPDANVTFTGSSRGTQKTIYYYTEIEDDSESTGTTRTFNGKLYTLYKTVKHDYNFLTYDEEYHPITGYTRTYSHAEPAFAYSASRGGYSADIGAGNTNYLYYERETYNITFTDAQTNHNVVVDGSPISPVDVKFNQNISGFVPGKPSSTLPGFVFDGWYADSACSTRVFFTQEEYDASTAGSKVLYNRMPAYNLQLFAGWDTEWYLIQIDPNGGAFPETGGYSTWFWKQYGTSELVTEYENTTRNYVEALDGTYYYAVRDRAFYGFGSDWDGREDSISGRTAYYTEDISDPAIVDLNVSYKYVQDAYRYANWYEVLYDENGKETGERLYNFSTRIDHDMTLRLHWKQLGTYYIRYNPVAAAPDGRLIKGVLDGGDSNEEVFVILDGSDYADRSDIVITRTADASGSDQYNFVGWTVRGGDGTICHPGEALEFKSKYAVKEGNKQVLTLDAVYSVVGTAKIVYDANGGTIDADALDYGAPADEEAVYSTSHEKTTAVIANLANNSEVYLSSGAGFVRENAVLCGWNTKPDGSGETMFAPGGKYYVDTKEPVTLYAVWKVKVYFDRNKTDGSWGGDWTEDGFVYDRENDLYYKEVIAGCPVDAPLKTPASGDEDMFLYWSETRYTDSGDVARPYDFNAPVMDEMTLYGFWGKIEVPVHAVDATEETLKNRDSAWLVKKNLQINSRTPAVSLAGITDAAAYANVDPEKYEYFAAASRSMAAISEDSIISAVSYNPLTQKAAVTYAGSGETKDLASGSEIYLVYWEKETLPVGYKLMNANGTLTNVDVKSSAPLTTDELGTFAVNEKLTAPFSYPVSGSYTYYAYAVGEKNASAGSALHILTGAANAEGAAARPKLRIKNTWRGFRCSTDGGESWDNAGYEIGLYVVYYQSVSRPLNVTVKEKTEGLSSDMAETFSYSAVVTQTETTYTRTDQYTRSRSGLQYVYKLASTGTPAQSGSLETKTVSEHSFTLADGGSETTALFHVRSQDAVSRDYYRSGSYYCRDYTYTESVQTLTVTQADASDRNFTTDHDGTGAAHVSNYVYSYAADGNNADAEAVFTNTHTPAAVTVHVAEAVGGGFVLRDQTLRKTDAADYTVSIPIGNTVELGAETPVDPFAGAEGYRFAGIIFGTTEETEDGAEITAEGTEIQSVSYKKMSEDGHYALYVNGTETLLPEGSEIFYVYCQMPTVVYMQEGANGTLTKIDPLRRSGAETFSVNAGTTVMQDERLEIGTEPFLISNSGTGSFRLPPDLDGTRALSLGFARLGAGAAGAADTASLDVIAEDKTLRLKVDGAQVKWSTNGTVWSAFSGAPTIYVIYRDKGYDLTVTKTVKGSAADPAREYTVTVSSPALEAGEYTVSGVDGAETVTVTAADGTGSFALTVKHGSSITISGLPQGTYTVMEEPAANTTLTAMVSKYPVTVHDNSWFAFTLNGDTSAALTNEVLLAAPTGLTMESDSFMWMLIAGMILTGCLILFTALKNRSKMR